MSATSRPAGAARARRRRPLLACAFACVLASGAVLAGVDAGVTGTGSLAAAQAHRGSAHRQAILRQARRSLAANHRAGLHGVGLAQRAPARAATDSTFGRFLRGVGVGVGAASAASAGAAAGRAAADTTRIFDPADCGGDPTGVADSSDAFDKAVAALLRCNTSGRVDGGGLTDLGGASIDLRNK